MMLKPPMNELLAQVPSRYMLVNVVAQRARQIASEADDQGIPLDDKPVSMALREVADGKCTPQDEEDEAV
ncbi:MULTISPECIES: DNA-directed RNA polymerase subunit omega [Oscillospiraceae]|uniref:DNA-directed RNA polymerase subunit omega n=1 Tax=Lawsonibacter faecis TaxID=2763052 RepID=A0A8J6MH14_9FIRM|nr:MULTISPECIES: DNA-directed RNA polymerase subunit omega [Oscillospiraceae]MTQ97385.1 DNA-directed RNA polymerase subunit omega [Pseudoflavonifractor sp. BIOML-A16]MTR06415.1 DNA-directed RNA polymerase subunit omega [Pseudoflavonifractor sp. BIOML-A15]MTR31690.1 DNA-directed RNA polymerase subunit omega [Pseudoflavonifractor sp. BIOML-A14]MTR72376.1 DNA-directed RNA polymerase subunit omega [Pseudoflavonifractor sp. BIOML-A18]MTS64262.1 DNA-directed RNA polymerase subunit omega [Pseudoflavo